MVVRLARQTDVPSLVMMLHQDLARLVPGAADPWRANAFLMQMVNMPQAAVFVAERDGRLAGLVAGAVGKFSLWMSDVGGAVEIVYVRPECRQSQMGVKLLQEFFSWAEAKGATSIIMKAPVGNTAERMAKFYRRLGFEPLETQFVRRCST